MAGCMDLNHGMTKLCPVRVVHSALLYRIQPNVKQEFSYTIILKMGCHPKIAHTDIFCTGTFLKIDDCEGRHLICRVRYGV